MSNDGGPIKNKGRHTLDRWDGERQDQHRALLLLAMQDPHSNKNAMSVADGRNVSRVIDCMEGYAKRATVRKWCDRRQWVDRIKGHGPDAQAYAIELYRALYMEKWGNKDIPHVGHLISLPMTTKAHQHPEHRTAVQAEAHRVIKSIMPEDPPPAVQEKVQGTLDKHRADTLQVNRAMQGLAKSAMSALGQSIKAATDAKFRKANPHIVPITCRVSDIPRLQRVLVELLEEEHRIEAPEATVAGGTALVDSVRVKIAKETGGNVLAAVLDDSREIVVMVEAMLAPTLTLADLQAEAAADAERGQG